MRFIYAISCSLLFITCLGQNTIWQTNIPNVSCFSSPKTSDLNKDGIQDIVFGAGLEQEISPQGMYALDGLNGNLLWVLPSRSQMFSSAQFQDLTGDDINDVLMAGRDAQLIAINGNTGNIIWEFWPDSLGEAKDSGWFNFYNPQWIVDLTNDGLMDILVSNGGNSEANSQNDIRPPGRLLVLDASDGSILFNDTMPDGKETYFSPLIYEDRWVFGSGGETKGGSLWSVKSDSFFDSGLSSAVAHLSDSVKGFIAVPSFADVTGDGNEDWLIPQLNEKLIVFDPEGDSVVWQFRLQGTENYVSPAIGLLNDDDIPDVALQFAKGPFPFYSEYYTYALDGEDGSILYHDSAGSFMLRSPNMVDWDNDGKDEILQSINYDVGFSTVELRNRFRIIDINDDTTYMIWAEDTGTNVFSMPTIVDLDKDGEMEMISIQNQNAADWYLTTGVKIKRIGLDEVTSAGWSGYMGNQTDGFYNRNSVVGIEIDKKLTSALVYPNPFTNEINVSTNGKTFIQLFDFQGQELISSYQSTLRTDEIPKGFYFLRIENQGLIHSIKLVK